MPDDREIEYFTLPDFLSTAEIDRQARNALLQLMRKHLWSYERPSCAFLHKAFFRSRDPKFIPAYLNLKTHTRAEFIRILEALGLPIDTALVDATLEAGSFENIKSLAAADAYKGTPLAPTDDSNPNSAKVRSGSSGGYRSVFSEEQISLIIQMTDRFFIGRNDPRFAECVGHEDR